MLSCNKTVCSACISPHSWRNMMKSFRSAIVTWLSTFQKLLRLTMEFEGLQVFVAELVSYLRVWCAWFSSRVLAHFSKNWNFCQSMQSRDKVYDHCCAPQQNSCCIAFACDAWERCDVINVETDLPATSVSTLSIRLEQTFCQCNHPLQNGKNLASCCAQHN